METTLPPQLMAYMGNTVFGPSEQNCDGWAHMTYYDKSRQLSFVWDGGHDYVDVCHGGYGEPVYARFSIDRGWRNTSEADRYSTSVDYFRDQCDKWIEDRNGWHAMKLHYGI